jgi:hypothetical protein
MSVFAFTCFGPSGPSSGSLRRALLKLHVCRILLLLLQSALQPLVGFRLAQLPFSILSRKVFTECRCQRHVQPLTWRRTRDLERSNFRHKRSPASEATLANPAAEGGTMGEKWPRNFAESGDFHGSGPEGSRKLRFLDFMTTAQDGGKVVSLTHRSHFCRINQ